jgi:hypothetical protein
MKAWGLTGAHTAEVCRASGADMPALTRYVHQFAVDFERYAAGYRDGERAPAPDGLSAARSALDKAGCAHSKTRYNGAVRLCESCGEVVRR